MLTTHKILLAVDSPGSGLGGGKLTIENPIKPESLTELINAILKIVVQVGTPILVLAIIYVGFLFVTARGNPGKLETAKEAFVWTLIGAAIVLGSFIISSVIQNTLTQIGIS